MGEHKNAIKNYEKALAIDLKIYGENHPDVAAIYNNLGDTWYSLGEYPKAMKYIEKALFILTSIFGNTHPRTITVKSNLESLKKKLNKRQ